MDTNFLHSDLSKIIQIAVAIVIVALIVKVFFSKKSGSTITEIDPHLNQISKKLLLDHLESIRKGRLVSEENISAKLLPALKEKIAEFHTIIASGVDVESEVKNLDQANINATKKSDTIKVKISALFRHEYFHDGKLIENPGDPESYVSGNEQPHFDSNYYILNFKIIGGSNYELIGITDNIMGNNYGDL